MASTLLKIPPGGSLFEPVRQGRGRRSARLWWSGLGGLMTLVALAGLVSRQATLALQAQRRADCGRNLERIGVALLNYHDVHGSFPAAAITSPAGQPLLSWRVAILPQLGLGGLYEQFRLDEPWDSAHNLALLARMPAVFACPSQPGAAGTTAYEVVVGPPGALDGAKPLFERMRGVEIREVTDGTPNTLMVAETANPVAWTRPAALEFEEDRPLPRFASHHPKGFNILLVDGSIRFLKNTIDPVTLRAVVTRDGGEVVGG